VAMGRTGWWRVVAALPLPFVIGLWALWRDVLTLEAAGVARTGGRQAVVEWALMSIGTVAVAGLLWAGSRPLRMLGYTFYALLLSIAFGAAGVLGVMHAFGGPAGDLDAPTWALVLLGLTAALCAFALLATAGLMVDDIKAAGEEQ
jgi:hypothetical protein